MQSSFLSEDVTIRGLCLCTIYEFPFDNLYGEFIISIYKCHFDCEATLPSLLTFYLHLGLKFQGGVTQTNNGGSLNLDSSLCTWKHH